ncbi:MAG: class I SAM-dependent rRNA methyltransferase [Rectinemataceae bacterium]
MERPIVILRPREDLRIRAGHPWIYDNEIARVEGTPKAGGEIEVQDSRRLPLGSAFWNPASRIRARIYSRKPCPADTAFFVDSIRAALEWRRRFFNPEVQSLRLVFGEADGIPGLIIDSFVGKPAKDSPQPGRWLTAQFLSLGVARRKELILDALAQVFPSTGIMERSEGSVLALEGLSPAVGVLRGTVPESILMSENGLDFAIDIAGGQKTGWFLDQRANRAAVARLAPGKRVLDAFCNQGGFGLSCAAAGASEVLAVDSSAEALAALRANAELNGLSGKVRTEEANVFDFLRTIERKGEKFGLIVLDPPAFAKNRASIEAAGRGYKDLNLRAMRMLERGGILATFSCSHWFGPKLFDDMIEDAAHDAGRRLRTIEERSQDLDHPIVSGYGESRYLKCRILEVE